MQSGVKQSSIAKIHFNDKSLFERVGIIYFLIIYSQLRSITVKKPQKSRSFDQFKFCECLDEVRIIEGQQDKELDNLIDDENTETKVVVDSKFSKNSLKNYFLVTNKIIQSHSQTKFKSRN